MSISNNLMTAIDTLNVCKKQLQADNSNEAQGKIQSVVKESMVSINKYLETHKATPEELSAIENFVKVVDGLGTEIKGANVARTILNMNITQAKAETQRPSRAKATEVIRSVLTVLPENPEATKYFTEIPVEDMRMVMVAEEVTVATPVGVASGGNRCEKILNKLVELKDKLGGSPVFGNKLPTIDEQDNKRTFLGVPMSAVKDWFTKTLKENWKPVMFWTAAAKLFNVSKETQKSQFEEAHLRIQRFELLVANKDRFVEILNNEEKDRYSEFNSITGLAWHPSQNGVGTEKMYFEFVEQFLTVHFEEALKKGDDALIEYFNAFSGVCFENQARNLEEYVIAHSKGNEEIASVSKVADWDTTQSPEKVFEKEMMVLQDETKEAPTPKGMLAHLQKKGIFDIEFGEAGAKAKPSIEQFNAWAQMMVDAMILEEDEQ